MTEEQKRKELEEHSLDLMTKTLRLMVTNLFTLVICVFGLLFTERVWALDWILVLALLYSVYFVAEGFYRYFSLFRIYLEARGMRGKL